MKLAFLLIALIVISLSCKKKVENIVKSVPSMGTVEDWEMPSARIISYFIESSAGVKKIRFKVKTSTKNPNTANLVSELYEDNAILLLPSTYTDSGINTKLIIYCHSGGGYVSETSSEVETDIYPKYFLSLGYAVLDVNGLPKEYAEKNKIDMGRHCGSFIALREYINAYNLVVKDYNIGDVFLFANSHGGLIAANLVNLTKIPFKAHVAVEPQMSLKENTWFVETGKLSFGEFNRLQNRANIIKIYGMKSVTTLGELLAANYEENKVQKYDPFKYVLDSNIKYRVPYKIINTKDDNIAYYEIAKRFVNFCVTKGANVVLSSVESGGHTSEARSGIVGSFKIYNNSYNLTPTPYEVASWFQLYGGLPVKTF